MLSCPRCVCVCLCVCVCVCVCLCVCVVNMYTACSLTHQLFTVCAARVVVFKLPRAAAGARAAAAGCDLSPSPGALLVEEPTWIQ